MTKSEYEKAAALKAAVEGAKNEADVFHRGVDSGETWQGLKPNFDRLRSNLEQAEAMARSLMEESQAKTAP